MTATSRTTYFYSTANSGGPLILACRQGFFRLPGYFTIYSLLFTEAVMDGSLLGILCASSISTTELEHLALFLTVLDASEMRLVVGFNGLAESLPRGGASSNPCTFLQDLFDLGASRPRPSALHFRLSP